MTLLLIDELVELFVSFELSLSGLEDELSSKATWSKSNNCKRAKAKKKSFDMMLIKRDIRIFFLRKIKFDYL